MSCEVIELSDKEPERRLVRLRLALTYGQPNGCDPMRLDEFSAALHGMIRAQQAWYDSMMSLYNIYYRGC